MVDQATSTFFAVPSQGLARDLSAVAVLQEMVLTDRGVAYAEPLCGRLVYASVFHVLSCLLCFAALRESLTKEGLRNLVRLQDGSPFVAFPGAASAASAWHRYTNTLC